MENHRILVDKLDSLANERKQGIYKQPFQNKSNLFRDPFHSPFFNHIELFINDLYFKSPKDNPEIQTKLTEDISQQKIAIKNFNNEMAINTTSLNLPTIPPSQLLQIKPHMPDIESMAIEVTDEKIYLLDNSAFLIIFHHYYCLYWPDQWFIIEKDCHATSILKYRNKYIDSNRNHWAIEAYLRPVKREHKFIIDKKSRFHQQKNVDNLEINTIRFNCSDVNGYIRKNPQYKKTKYLISYSNQLQQLYEIIGVVSVNENPDTHLLLVVIQKGGIQFNVQVLLAEIVAKDIKENTVNIGQNYRRFYQSIQNQQLNFKVQGQHIILYNQKSFLELLLIKNNEANLYEVNFHQLDLHDKIFKFENHHILKILPNESLKEEVSNPVINRKNKPKRRKRTSSLQEMKSIISQSDLNKIVNDQQLMSHTAKKKSVKPQPVSIVDFYIFNQCIYIISENFTLYIIEQNAVGLIGNLMSLISQKNKKQLNRIEFQSQENIITTKFEENPHQSSILLIIQTECDGNAPFETVQSNNIENNVYIFEIRRRQMLLLRKVNNLLNLIKLQNISIKEKNIEYNLRLMKFDQKNYSLYYEYKNQNNYDFIAYWKLIKVNILGVSEYGEQDFNEKPIVDFHKKRVCCDIDCSSIVLISNDLNFSAVIYKKVPFYLQIFLKFKNQKKHIIHKLLRKPLCAAINHLPYFRLILVSYGTHITQYNVAEPLTNQQSVSQGKQIQIQNVRFMEYSKNMKELMVANQSIVYFLNPWDYSVHHVITIDNPIYRIQLEIKLNNTYLVLSNNPKASLLTKRSSLRKAREIQFEVFPIQGEKNNPYKIKQSLPQQQASNILYETSRTSLFIVLNSDLYLYELSEKKKIVINLCFLEAGELVTSLKVEGNYVILGTNYGNLRVLFIKEKKYGLFKESYNRSLYILSIFLGDFIEKTNALDDICILLISENQISNSPIIRIQLNYQIGLRMLCVTEFGKTIELDIKINDLLSNKVGFIGQKIRTSYANFQQPLSITNYLLSDTEFQDHLKEQIVFYNMTLLEKKQNLQEQIAEIKSSADFELSRIKKLMEMSYMDALKVRNQIDQAHQKNTFKLFQLSSGTLKGLKIKKQLIEQQSKNLFRKNFDCSQNTQEITISNQRVVLKAKHLQLENETEQKQRIYKLQEKEYNDFIAFKTQKLKQMEKQCDELQKQIKLQKQIDQACEAEQEQIFRELKKSAMEKINQQVQAIKKVYSELSMKNTVMTQNIQRLSYKISFFEKQKIVMQTQIEQLRVTKDYKRAEREKLQKKLGEVQAILDKYMKCNGNVETAKNMIKEAHTKNYLQFLSRVKEQQIRQLMKNLNDFDVKEGTANEKLSTAYQNLMSISNQILIQKKKYNSLNALRQFMINQKVKSRKRMVEMINRQLQNFYTKYRQAKSSSTEHKKGKSSLNSGIKTIEQKIDYKSQEIKLSEKNNKITHIYKQGQFLLKEFNKLKVQQESLKKEEQIAKSNLMELKDHMNKQFIGFRKKISIQSRGSSKQSKEKKYYLPKLTTEANTSCMKVERASIHDSDKTKRKRHRTQTQNIEKNSLEKTNQLDKQKEKKKSVSLENKGGIIHRDKKITSQLMGRNNRLMVSKPRNYKLRL